MGVLMRAKDWAKTPLGAPDTWDQALKTAVSICLTTPFVGAVHWGPDLRILYNEAYIPALAERHPEALGQPFRDVWPEIWDVLGPQVERVLDTGRGFRTENQLLRMERRGRVEDTYWMYSFAPIYQESGAIGGIFVTAIDTTENVLADQRRAADTERQRRLFEQAPGFIAIVSGPDHVFEFVNAAYRRLIGDRHYVGQTVRQVLPELEGQGFFELIDGVYATGERFVADNVPIQIARPDATTEQRFLDFIYEPVVDEDGRVTGIFVEGHDVTDAHHAVTERKVAEARLVELNETLETRVADRTAELRYAEDALRQSQKLEAIGRLTGGVAHDFNNLLTVIGGSVELLRRPNVSEERRDRYINAIAESSERATKLTSQLLAFARRQVLKPEIFDANANVRSLLEMMGTLTGARIRIETRLQGDSSWINADASQFDTALINMAVNARDAMNGDGCFVIETRNTSTIPASNSHPAISGDFVVVSLIDSGAGIAPDKLEQIFEPFFTTKEVGSGTGLGLSQVFGFVKQSGGEVQVRSELGEGSTFTLYLPRVDAPAQSAVDGIEPLVDGHGACILIVEDNAEVGAFATQALSNLGYETVLAVGAAEALAELAKEPERFDAVFSDVVMPGMNGVQLG